MTITVRSASTNWAEGASSVSVTKPAGTAQDDILIAVMFNDYSSGTGSAMSAPAGWTQAGTTATTASGSYNPVGKVWWKRAGASEPASYSFGTSTSSSTVIGITALSGADPSSPIKVAPQWSTAGGSSTSHVAPSIAAGSGQAADDLLLCASASDYYDSARGNSYTPPSGMTETTDVSAQFTYMSTAVLALTGTAATGTKTFTPNRASQDPFRTMSMVIANGAIAKVGNVTATLKLAASAPGVKAVSGAVAGTLRGTASESGMKVATGTVTASLRTSGGETGTKATSGSPSSAPTKLSASVAGQRINVLLATLKLAASVQAARPGAGYITATMLLDAAMSNVSRVTSSSVAASDLQLSASSTATSARSGSPSPATLRLGASLVGVKRAVGALVSTPLRLQPATIVVTRNTPVSLVAALKLSGSVSDTSRATAVALSATMKFAASETAVHTTTPAVDLPSANLRLSAHVVGTRIVVEVASAALLATGAKTVPYELVMVARIPQTAGPPLLLEVDPIEWTGIGITEELSKPSQLAIGAKVSKLTEPVLQRLRAPAELATELRLYRSGKVMFAGPMLGWQVQSESITINAQGLLAYLKMMLVASDQVFAQVDQFTIAKTLIDQWQALDFGNFGIDTSGIGLSGVKRDATYLAKELHNVGQRVEELGKRINGFDINVDPATRKLELSYPLKGIDRSVGEDQVVFDASNVTSTNVTCSVAPGDVASEAFGTGTGDSTIFSTATNLVRRKQYGRTAIAGTFDGVSEQSTLDAYTSGMLDPRDEALLIPGPDTRVTPDADLSSYDVGDTVSYQLHDQLGLGGAFRLRKRTVSVSQTGQESVSVAFV